MAPTAGMTRSTIHGRKISLAGVAASKSGALRLWARCSNDSLVPAPLSNLRAGDLTDFVKIVAVQRPFPLGPSLLFRSACSETLVFVPPSNRSASPLSQKEGGVIHQMLIAGTFPTLLTRCGISQLNVMLSSFVRTYVELPISTSIFPFNTKAHSSPLCE